MDELGLGPRSGRTGRSARRSGCVVRPPRRPVERGQHQVQVDRERVHRRDLARLAPRPAARPRSRRSSWYETTGRRPRKWPSTPRRAQASSSAATACAGGDVGCGAQRVAGQVDRGPAVGSDGGRWNRSRSAASGSRGVRPRRERLVRSDRRRRRVMPAVPSARPEELQRGPREHAARASRRSAPVSASISRARLRLAERERVVGAQRDAVVARRCRRRSAARRRRGPASRRRTGRR